MPVFNTAANQIQSQPVSSFYEGKAVRLALKNKELANQALEKDIELADQKMSVDQQNADTATTRSQIDLAKLEREAGKDAVDAMIEGFAGGMAVYDETGDEAQAYEATVTKLAAMDPNTDPEEARQILDENMGGRFNPETVGAFLMTADEYRQRGRSPSAFINFRNPETGEEASVRTDSPEAEEYAENGWTRIGLTQKSLTSDNPGAIFGSTGDRTNDRKTTEVVTSAENLTSSIERIEQQVEAMPQTGLGFPGTVTRAVDNTVNAVIGFGEMFKGTAEINGETVSDSALLDVRLYQDMFEGPAAQSAALQANQVGLAYALARSANPDGRISDNDVKHQIQRVRLDNSSKAQIQAAMFEVKREVYVNTANHLRVGRYNQTKDGAEYYDSLMDKITEMDAEAARKSKNRGIQTIASDEEYEALPSGTQFYAPDGTLRQKP